MIKFWATRLIIVLATLAAVNVGGYAFAYVARTGVGNPFFDETAAASGLWPGYTTYLSALWHADFSSVSLYRGEFGQVVLSATGASLGLLGISLLVSLVAGGFLGLSGARRSPPGVQPWLTVLATLGLAAPSFFIGTLAIVAVLTLLLRGSVATSLVPIHGFGWDAHLVLPVLALALRPTALFGQMVASLLAGELSKLYIMAARGKGLSAGRVLRHHALRNVLAPLSQTMAAVVRILLGEQILVEWLFAWPGLGRLLASTLIPGKIASAQVEQGFLDPPLVATVLTLFAFLLLFTDNVAALAVRLTDPRQRAP